MRRWVDFSSRFFIILIMANIVLPEMAFREKEGVVVLPLKKWQEIERKLEDLEMYSSELAKEIEARRKEKKVVSLKSLLKKYNI